VARILHLHSADPTKAARLLSLVVEASAADRTTKTTDKEGPSTSKTGDDESAKDAGADADADAGAFAHADAGAGARGAAGAVRRRKSQKTRPAARKAVIDNFEMLHNQTADLYALKAIRNRHVLAHQELKHMLTK
jgi:hypothetical protein